MADKLTQDVQDIVDSIFKQKEEVAMRKETEDALNKSADKINELVASLEAKDEELGISTAKLEELEILVSEMTDKNKELDENLGKATSDFEAEKAELTKRAETAEEELLNMKKDQLAKARYEELVSDGVAVVEEKAKKDQVAKIREMEDEEFSTYKTDRVELRKAIIAELETSTSEEQEVKAEKKVSSKEETAEETIEEDASELEAEVEGNEEEAAADSEDSIDPMRAVAAALNMEVMPDKNTIAKYRELGKAMAKKFASKSE